MNLSMEHALSAAELLNVWERARSLSPADRALLLMPRRNGASREELAQFGIGRRDAELLKLREKLFGSRMTGRADCPACGQPMEMNFASRKSRPRRRGAGGTFHRQSFGEYEIGFRLPNSSDLATLRPRRGCCDAKAPPCAALRPERDTRRPAARSGSIAERTLSVHLSERMSELDPQGDVQLALTCPQCSHQWHAPLDIVSFIWSEIHALGRAAAARRSCLASRYGWREADILALSPWRRQAYLELIEQ